LFSDSADCSHSSAEQSEHDQRHQRKQPGQTYIGGILGERVDLDRDRKDGQVGADDGDDS
jgi:hypothetical protein